MMKVVLLLDTSLTSGEKVHDDYSEAIIVALRLLSFLGNRTDRDHRTERPSPSPKSKSKTTSLRQRHDEVTNKKPNFKWGFKFFSSAGSVVRAKFSKKTSSLTNSWNQDSFQIFQKNAETVLKNERDTTNKRSSLTHPSERLTTALTEVLHDFEWQDKSELLKSPGRSMRKRISHVEVDDKDKQNVVFIFSKAPSSRTCLRRFSNKVVIDSDVFIDSFMSPALLEEYKNKSRINIYWVDFNRPQDETFDKETNDSLNIVMDSLKKLGGNLLHKYDILKYFPSNATCLSFTELHPPINTLPSETSLLHGLSLFNDGISIGVPSKDIDSSAFVTEFCKVELTGSKLTPFVNVNDNATDERPDDTPATLSREEASDDQTRLCLSDADIELQGCMPSIAAADIVSNLEMHQSTVLTCDKNSNISLLLRMLVKTQNLAIIKISRNQDDINYKMAVLTALTSTCGHVFFLSWNQQLSIEKALLFDRRTTTQDSSPSKPATVTQPFNSHVLNSWHQPGSTKQLAQLIVDLKNRPNFQNSSSSVTDLLGKVKKSYLKTKQIQQQKQQSVLTSTPLSGQDSSLPSKIAGSAESESGSSSLQAQMRRGLSRRSSSSLSRGRLLVERARSASILMAGEEECSNQSMSRVPSPGGRRTSGSSGFESLNIQNEGELLEYLNKQYSQVLNAGVAMEASIQAMLTVTCYFMSTKEMVTNPQKSAIEFIRKHLALNPTKLKDKYGEASDVDKKSQAVEYKLQVMLLLEMASFVPDNEDFQGDRLLNALVSMVRVLSFIIGPTSVREFMANATDSYCGTLPRVLMDVYDELDLPYPGILAKLTSPSAPSTVWGLNMSVGSVDSYRSGPGSSQPPSSGQRLSQGTRRTSLKQHPSLTDFRQKKQILVDKVKSKPVSKTEGKRSAKDKNKQKGKSTKTKSGADLGRAKRNLFSDKYKVKKAKDRLQLTPKGKKGKPKLLVPGTPAHKQTSERILSRQKRLRDHLNIKPDVQVVEESPVKDDDPHGRVGNKPARFLLRESFYSSNSQQSRIVAKSIEMEEKGGRPAASPNRFLQPSHSHGSLISAVRGESPILSPRSRMMKSFMASPSSEAKSDRKKIITPNPSTPHSHLPRRSPRKSVKKLLFHPAISATTTTTSTITSRQESTNMQGINMMQNSLLEAKLVFDGENASDAPPSLSPLKRSRASNAHELKTPEKRNQLLRFDAWESSSCPPFQVTPTKSYPRKQVRTPELSFKNVFNTPSTSNKSPEPKFVRNIPRKNSKDIHNDLSNPNSNHDLYKKSNTVGSIRTGLKKSVSDSMRFDRDFVNLQKRISPQKGKEKFSGASKRVSSGSIKFSDARSRTSRRDSFSNSANQFDPVSVDDGEVVLSTPKKGRHDSNYSSFHTTPSKVTFSESFLISPPTGSGRPVALTPTRSILKGSPSRKSHSFVRRIELTDNVSQKLPDASFLSPNCKKPSVLNSPDKMSTILSCRERTSNSMSRDTNSHCGLSNKSPLKPDDQRVKLSTNRFDQDSSSSSCESSSLNTNQTQALTVVTAHTPSPSNKCKGINKWMRKKRNSGSRTVSSSSSSSVSPSSSSEFKEKVSGQGMESSETYASAGDVNAISIGEGKNLKRNLFSIDAISSSQMDSSPPRKRGKRKDVPDHDENVLSSKTKIQTSRTIEGEDKSKSIKLFSHTSGGFSNHNERSVHSQDASILNVKKQATVKDTSNKPINSSSAAAEQHGPFSCFSPNRSPSKKHRAFHLSSSLMGEGSQGFLFDSENHDLDTPSSDVEIPPGPSSIAITNSPSSAKISVDVNKSPINPKATPSKKPQYSPALSTTGLLRLIGSPLLEETEANVNNTDRRRTRSSKSKKHLNWPL